MVFLWLKRTMVRKTVRDASEDMPAIVLCGIGPIFHIHPGGIYHAKWAIIPILMTISWE